MRILLVNPDIPLTFWSFKNALKFISKKAVLPPLGLLTVAAILPKEWKTRLVDMTTTKLRDRDIRWADYVFITAMMIQRKSADQVIERCRNIGTKVVAGGPLFTSLPEEYMHVDHLVLKEAELTLPLFIQDLKNECPRKVYNTHEKADLRRTPVPRWNLIKKKKYAMMSVQYSRGCPFNCDFCDVTTLFGHRIRMKTTDQVLDELEELYALGWRDEVFFVDDNFIGNKVKLKKEILPAIAEWMDKRKSPFFLNTEASINLADDDNLMKLMVRAGFEAVFIGIESPNEESLVECNKNQNRNRNLISSIKRIQDFGLEVQGGFIVGFDNDPPSIFEKLTNFIQESGIVTAMVGLLNAPKGTKLQKRLENEGRLLKDFTGNNTDFSINFIPQMSHKTLLDGYKKILDKIYSPQYYYERVTRFLKDFKPKKKVFHLNMSYVLALFKSMYRLGLLGEERIYYWKLFFWSLFRKPQLFSLAILFTIYGFHFRRISSSLS
jgi:radical SAM superfamily enzyme YgiQ (UPF0313 family)